MTAEEGAPTKECVLINLQKESTEVAQTRKFHGNLSILN